VDSVEFPHAVPQPFTLQRIRSEELIAQDSIEKFGDNDSTPRSRSECHPLDALVRSDSKHRHVTVTGPTWKTFAPRERGLRTWRKDVEALYAGYSHNPPDWSLTVRTVVAIHQIRRIPLVVHTDCSFIAQHSYDNI
jgi:hypothetical protein